ncbi:MAG: restriction endonuclease [Pelagibaca sp.]|nr:restriction endonuclease [Pelagibaca sp.]
MSEVAEISSKYLTNAAMNAVPVGYKQTEVGVIPEDWTSKQLQKVFSLKNGYSFKGEFFSRTGPIVLTPGNFKLDGGLYFEDRNTKRYSSNYPKDYEFDNGDLVIVMTDLTPDCNLLGKPAFVDSNEKILHNQRIGKVVGLNSGWDFNFLFYTLLSPSYLSAVKNAATGSTVRHTSPKTIASAWVAEPPIREQTAIANALSDVDALISELEKLIAKKQAIKTATMQQLLTGRTRLPEFALREDGTPKGTKLSELGEIPKDWDVLRLGNLAKFFKGSGLPKSELLESGRIKCIHYGQLFTTYGPKIERVISRTKQAGTVTSQENDVLMPTSDVTPNGLATASCITESGVILGGDILIIRADKKKLNGIFFSYLVNILRDQVMQLVTGSTVYHLYGSDMAKFEFPFPSNEEQVAIATILSDMDEELQVLEQRLSKTRQIKQGMMQELLTGRTRLI